MELDVFTYCCSVQGKEHIRRDIPCQDASFLEEVAEGLYLLVIADGCGSAAKADEGSRAAAVRAKAFIESEMPLKSRNRTVKILKTLCCASLLDADRFLSNLAEDRHCRESDFATTLSVCLYDANLRRLGFAHIGDGAIWVRTNGEYKKLTTEIRPPFMPDHYVTLLYHGASHWLSGEAKDVSAVLACTDGMLHAIQPEPSFCDGSSGSVFCRPVLEYFLNRQIFSKDDPQDIASQMRGSLDAVEKRHLHALVEARINRNFQCFCGDDVSGDPAVLITDLLWRIRDDKTVCAVIQNDE
ncbi:MAG: protein phosphatase 2C domain-containing protein [Clostridia bacterium]